MSILVVFEHGHKMSWETVAAGQQTGKALGLPVDCVVIGGPGDAIASRCALRKVVAVEHPLLAGYTADGYTAALEQVIRAIGPTLVLFPHTYQTRDFAPKAATRFNAVLVSDVVRIEANVDTGPVFVRQLFQGKLSADVRAEAGGGGIQFVSLQAGAYREEQIEAGTAAVEQFAVTLDAGQIRQKPEAPFRESARAVDLTSAPIIVSVGRGIKEAENIGLVEELAAALGGELAASRPICDNGWLPMERQVGSSGQTVSPKLYLAVGISGAIQHVVGMKGAKCIVAVNKDPNAPIFELADYGLVGDLFEIVPALTEEVRKAKG
jgi:electron transfer flavoprotein alpha subunit